MIGHIKRRARRLKRKLFQPAHPDTKLRLHLGCGDDYWPGYVNVDASPTANCDIRLDFTRIGELYPDGSVAEIALIHSLSYLRLWQARDLFRDLFDLLEPGGCLIIELPDLAKCARRILESENDPENYLEAVRAIYAFGLEYNTRREMYAPYPFGWSGWHLKSELERAGFRQVAIRDPQTHDVRLWRDVRVEAVK